MKILGKISASLDNFSIISRKEHEMQIQFSEEKFKENFTRLNN
jgi:activator of HSP90 ATPase